ncbi:MAG TPA: nuclear transport factor 2 family protein [Bryobacteraceae bacterium]|nr:nuclear transport factor 2 family protein [Bryobacteraceae bacterium]
MFRAPFRLIAVAVLTATALCLHASRTAGPKPSLDTPQTVTATILRLEKTLDEAESHHRVAKVADMIADDYRGITVGGTIITKRDVLAAVGGTGEVSSESSDRQVRMLDNAAVYTALVLDHGTDPKTQNPYTLATRVMDVWQKRGRDWKLVNDQATGVAPGN